jgi:hypothetical protein
MFIAVAVILLILWVLGLIGHMAGGLIHILIVLALISIIYHFLRGNKNTTT